MPLKLATIDSLADVGKVVVHDALPVLGLIGWSIHPAIWVPFAEKLTVPDAGPLTETTLASNVTLCDVATLVNDEVREVVVGVAGGGGEG